MNFGEALERLKGGEKVALVLGRAGRGLGGRGMKYRKRPVEIEAVRFIGLNSDGDPTFGGDVTEWLVEACAGPEEHAGSIWVGPGQEHKGEPSLVLHVGTLEGHMIASPDDWIVRGIKGELYTVKDEIFQMTYDRAEEASEAA